MPIRTSIPCTHCGEIFAVTLPTSGSGTGSFRAQHSPGCGKSTVVHYTKGVVDSTRKG